MRGKLPMYRNYRFDGPTGPGTLRGSKHSKYGPAGNQWVIYTRQKVFWEKIGLSNKSRMRKRNFFIYTGFNIYFI